MRKYGFLKISHTVYLQFLRNIVIVIVTAFVYKIYFMEKI